MWDYGVSEVQISIQTPTVVFDAIAGNYYGGSFLSFPRTLVLLRSLLFSQYSA